MDNIEKLLVEILAELKILNGRAERQVSDAVERSSSVDALMKMATEALGGKQ